MEDKMKLIRPGKLVPSMYSRLELSDLDGTQPFDLIPSSSRKYDDGNLRHPPLVHLRNDRQAPVPSKFLRSSGRLSHLNQNHASEYQGQALPGVGDLRDPALEQRIRRDRAAARIQSVFRGYTVRKSLQWIDEEKRPTPPQSKRHKRVCSAHTEGEEETFDSSFDQANEKRVVSERSGRYALDRSESSHVGRSVHVWFDTSTPLSTEGQSSCRLASSVDRSGATTNRIANLFG